MLASIDLEKRAELHGSAAADCSWGCLWMRSGVLGGELHRS